MYHAIYLNTIKQGKLASYLEAWKLMSSYMTSNRGAISSAFYHSEDKTKVVIHSTWPNFEVKQRSWPLPKESDQSLVDVQKTMRDCSEGKPDFVALSDLQVKDELNKILAHMLITMKKPAEMIKSLKKKILIYKDEGVGKTAYDVVNTLRHIVNLDFVDILVIDAEYIRKTLWKDTARLFIMPGGRARPYYTSLGTEWEEETVDVGQTRKIRDVGDGNQAIKDFVLNGGNYLGICAGAYYGAGLTVFERSGKYEVLDEGALSFYPGTAEGPAYGLDKYEYHSESGSEKAMIQSISLPGVNNLKVYFNGGCYFHDENQSVRNAHVLASYSNVNKSSEEDLIPPIAVVENEVGLGRSILSGMHFEIMSSAPKIEKEMSDFLIQDDESRLRFSAIILGRLGIPLNNKYHHAIYVNPLNKTRLLESFKLEEDFKCDNLPINYEHFPEIDSTQKYCRAPEQLKKLSDGKWLAVSADRQSSGVGTNNRNWQSPLGNIYTTIAALMPADRPYTFSANLPQIVGYSIAQTLKFFDIANVEIKWVNDVLVNDKKIAGILCEKTQQVYENQEVFLIGIGLNVNMTSSQCESIVQPTTSMSIELNHRNIDKQEVLMVLQSILYHNVQQYIKHGFSYFAEEINSLLAYRNDTIVFDTEANNIDPRVYAAKVIGLDKNGGLLLQKKGDSEVFSMTIGRILRGKDLEPHLHLLKSDKDTSQPHNTRFGFLKNVEDEFQFKRIKFDVIDSTQQYCRREKDKLFAHSNQVVVIAKEQTAGVGTRIERRWISPPNVGVYATFAMILPNNDELLFQKMEEQPITVQIASLAVVRTLQSFGLSPKMKWRNDVLVEDKKISGILCEMITLDDGRRVGLAGIGINVNTKTEDLAKVVDQSVTSMMAETNREFNVSSVFKELQKNLTHYIKLYFARGYEACKNDILGCMAYIGDNVELEVTDEKHENPQRMTGVFLGLDSVGKLMLQTQDEIKVITYGRIVKRHEQQLLNDPPCSSSQVDQAI